MLILDYYIGKIIAVSTVLVLTVFLSVTIIFGLIDELRGSNASYQFLDAAQYVALTIPRRIYEVLPYVSFIGALVGLSILSTNSEIVVLRAAGLSVERIFGSVMVPVLGFLALGIIVGESVAAGSEQAAETYKAQSLQKRSDIRFQETYWYREGSLFMSVDAITTEGDLVGISQYWQNPSGELVLSRRAASAEYRSMESPYWLLRGVTETTFNGLDVSIQNYPEKIWRGRATPRLLGTSVLLDPNKLSILSLYYQISYMEREGLDAKPYQLALWQKCFQPLMVAGLALVALYFVLGPLRNSGIGSRVASGVFVGLVFKYFQDLFAPISLIFELPVVLSVILPILISWALGWYGLKRLS